MKKFKNLIYFLALAVTVLSCKKHVIEYNNKDLGQQAEFQLHYMVPIESETANNIYRVEINGQLYADNSGPLYTYNAIPSGAVGRFFFTKIGENNIKLYKGTDLELVYDQNCTLTEGKQNIVIYDFNQPPKVIDNGYPYVPLVTAHTSTVGWVKFYNFIYDSAGTPTPLKLQYQWQYILDNDTGEWSDWHNLGEPAAFGETSGWDTVHINKTVKISSGYARINYRIRVIGQDGSDQGNLQVMNSRGDMVEYSDYWYAYVGRRVHHFYAGMRTESPRSRVRLFYAL